MYMYITYIVCMYLFNAIAKLLQYKMYAPPILLTETDNLKIYRYM